MCGLTTKKVIAEGMGPVVLAIDSKVSAKEDILGLPTISFGSSLGAKVGLVSH